MINSTNIYPKNNFPDFLIGNWKVENKEIYEEWEFVSEIELKGKSYKIINGKSEITEYLSITKKENKIVYSANVINQNDGHIIEFNLNFIDNKTYSFENPNHDFPQKIIYHIISENKLFVEVVGDNDKGFSFNLFRIIN